MNRNSSLSKTEGSLLLRYLVTAVPDPGTVVIEEHEDDDAGLIEKWLGESKWDVVHFEFDDDLGELAVNFIGQVKLTAVNGTLYHFQAQLALGQLDHRVPLLAGRRVAIGLDAKAGRIIRRFRDGKKTAA